MGDIYQLDFVRKNKHLIKGPILEVGGKDYGNTPDFRSEFPGEEYISIDQEDGKNVDVVVDLTDDIESIRQKLPQKFRTVLNFSVMEHCRNPIKMAENITMLLADDGMVFIGVPHAWRIHAYPNDYFRFTPEGVKVLFPDLSFDEREGNISTTSGEIRPIQKENFYINFHGLRNEVKEKRLSFFSALVVFFFLKTGLLKEIFRNKRMFPATMVNMIGRKKTP